MPMFDAIRNGIQQYNPSAYTVDYNAFKNDPAKVTAALTRAQWADYQARYVPVENALMNMTSFKNPGIIQEELNGAIGNNGYVQQNMDSQALQATRNISRFGANMTAEQQQAMAKNQSLTRSTAIVDAANNIRKKIMDRDMQIAVGGIPNSGRAYGLPATEAS